MIWQLYIKYCAHDMSLNFYVNKFSSYVSVILLKILEGHTTPDDYHSPLPHT